MHSEDFNMSYSALQFVFFYLRLNFSVYNYLNYKDRGRTKCRFCFYKRNKELDALKEEMDSKQTDPARVNKIKEEFRKQDDEISLKKSSLLAQQNVDRPFEFTKWESLLNGLKFSIFCICYVQVVSHQDKFNDSCQIKINYH